MKLKRKKWQEKYERDERARQEKYQREQYETLKKKFEGK